MFLRRVVIHPEFQHDRTSNPSFTALRACQLLFQTNGVDIGFTRRALNGNGVLASLPVLPRNEKSPVAAGLGFQKLLG
jgi:hypothetical protein